MAEAARSPLTFIVPTEGAINPSAARALLLTHRAAVSVVMGVRLSRARSAAAPSVMLTPAPSPGC